MLFLLLVACAYRTPPRSEWPAILRGASFDPLTPELRIAKRPLFLDAGGQTISFDAAPEYMRRLEARLENAIRKPGTQITRVGTDVTLVVVRSSFIYADSPEITPMGNEIMGHLARALREFDMTWVEITGFTDAMNNQQHAMQLSRDMAERIAVYLAKHRVKPIRMFITGRGSSNPIADQTDMGRLMNRRVEIRISPVFTPIPSGTFNMVRREEPSVVH